LELVHAGYAHPEDLGDLGKVELFDEVELDHELEPLGQLADLLGEAAAVFFLQQHGLGIVLGRGEQAGAVGITLLHRIEPNRGGVAAQLFELGKREAERGGGFRRLWGAVELHAQVLLGALDAAALLARTADFRRGAAQQVDHRAAHAQLGIGGEAVLARPVVALSAFGQRDEAGLHQVLDVERRPRAAGKVPGEVAQHRQEARDAVGDLATVGLRGRKAGMILNHAAKASLSYSGAYSGCGAMSDSAAGSGCWSASPPMTAMTSIGWATGSSFMEMTRQP